MATPRQRNMEWSYIPNRITDNELGTPEQTGPYFRSRSTKTCEGYVVDAGKNGWMGWRDEYCTRNMAGRNY